MRKPLFWSMIVSAVVVTAWRTLALPMVVGDGRALTHVDYPLLILMAVVTAVLLLLGRAKEEIAAPHHSGRIVLFGGAAFGGVLALASLWDVVRFIWKGAAPAPSATLVSAADRMLLCVSMLAGFLGGVFLVVWFCGLLRAPDHPFNWVSRRVLLVSGSITGVLLVLLFYKAYQQDMLGLDASGAAVGGTQRMTTLLPLVVALVAAAMLILACIRSAKYHTFSEKWLWLLLPLWAFARLARYNVVYASSVDISPAVYEFFVYAVIMLFLLQGARYFSGMQKPTRFLRGLSAATAVLCVAAGVSRAILLVLHPDAAAYCPIPSVTEVALGVFAAVTAIGLRAEEASLGEA